MRGLRVCHSVRLTSSVAVAMSVKLATATATDSASVTNFVQNRLMVAFRPPDSKNQVHFDLGSFLQGQNQGQTKGNALAPKLTVWLRWKWPQTPTVTASWPETPGPAAGLRKWLLARYLLNDCENSMLYYPYHMLRYSRYLSTKFTFLLRLQSLKICFRSKQFCSIIPQLTRRRWEVSWDVLSGSVLAIAARGRGRSKSAQ